MQNLLKRWHLLYTLAGYICQCWYQYWRWWGLSSCQFGDFCHIISFTTRAELHLANEIFLKSSVDCKVKEGLDQAVHLNKILLTSFRGKMSAGKLFMAQINLINCWEEGCIGKYALWGNLHPERLPEDKAQGQSRGPRGANCRGRHIFQFIPTRGSVLPFFSPKRECIGNYNPNSWVVLTVLIISIHSRSIKKNACTS